MLIGLPRSSLILLACTAVLTVALAYGPRPGIPAGLNARYFANADWAGAPVVERIDTQISSAALAALPQLSNLTAVSVEWSGYLVVRESALHRIATKSDDGSWLWIDGRLVVDNGGIHPEVNRVADVWLEQGVHPIRVRYMQDGGGHAMQMGQAGGRGAFGPAGPLLPVAMSYWEFRARELWPLAIVLLWYGVVAHLLWRGIRTVAATSSARDFVGGLTGALRDPVFLLVALVGLAASAAHIGYGLPTFVSLSGDEFDPLATLGASRSSFHNWNLRWPTLHMHAMALALQPFDWARALFDLPLGDPTVNAAMFLIVRALSLLLLFSTLLLTFDAARLLQFDRVTGYFAVALLASMPVVAYFGALANLEIPQLFWATFAFWSWLMFVRAPTLARGVVFGTIVGLSLACKDQLYGFYVAAPFAVLAVVARVDRRVLFVGVATLAGFAIGHQLPMEWDRLVAHVRSMTTVDSVPFRVFTHSVDGHVGLFVGTLRSFLWAAGLPAACAFAGGCVYLVMSGRRRLLEWLLLPLVTYYVTFLVVILYVYDRFLIAFLPIAAIVGGEGLRAVVRAAPMPRLVRVGVPALLFTAAALSMVGMNAVFLGDPRHRARTWLAHNAPCGSSAGVTYSSLYVPPLDCYDVWTLIPSRTERMVRLPDYLVLNEAYMRRFRGTPSGLKFLHGVESGTLGYRLAFRARTTPPLWAPLYWEERFWNAEEDAETILDKPLHGIEVWERVRP